MNGYPTIHGKQAFTLMDLLVVIAIIGILAALLLPSFSRAKEQAQGVYCMNNGKQMMVALHLYASDYRGWLVPNPDYPDTNAWVRGEMENPADATNTDYLRESKLAPYIDGATGIFKCPGDSSDHVRTFSMSQAVGTKPEPPPTAVDGPWLDGTHAHKANHPWRTYGTFGEMVAPTPSALWVFMDESRYNINDAAFAVSMTLPTEMIDWPETYHNRAACIAFADGHSEIHQWEDGRTRVGRRVAPGPHIQSPDNLDIIWLQQITSAKANTSSP